MIDRQDYLCAFKVSQEARDSARDVLQQNPPPEGLDAEIRDAIVDGIRRKHPGSVVELMWLRDEP